MSISFDKELILSNMLRVVEEAAGAWELMKRQGGGTQKRPLGKESESTTDDLHR